MDRCSLLKYLRRTLCLDATASLFSSWVKRRSSFSPLGKPGVAHRFPALCWSCDSAGNANPLAVEQDDARRWPRSYRPRLTRFLPPAPPRGCQQCLRATTGRLANDSLSVLFDHAKDFIPFTERISHHRSQRQQKSRAIAAKVYRGDHSWPQGAVIANLDFDRIRSSLVASAVAPIRLITPSNRWPGSESARTSTGWPVASLPTSVSGTENEISTLERSSSRKARWFAVTRSKLST